MSYLPALAVAGLIVAVAAWAGALATALWLVVATAVGYAYLYAVARHRQLQYHGGVRTARKSQPELAAVVDEVMERAGIRGLDGVWLVPGATAGALLVTATGWADGIWDLQSGCSRLLIWTSPS